MQFLIMNDFFLTFVLTIHILLHFLYFFSSTELLISKFTF
jgi:hypothetical protein